jgi:hypothetical protein
MKFEDSATVKDIEAPKKGPEMTCFLISPLFPHDGSWKGRGNPWNSYNGIPRNSYNNWSGNQLQQISPRYGRCEAETDTKTATPMVLW